MNETISPSQLRAMNCRQKWYWSYVEGYRPILPNHNLEFGSAIHAALEYHYKPNPMQEPRDMVVYFDNWMEQKVAVIRTEFNNNLFDDDIQKFHDLKELGKAMLTGYLNHWGDPGMEDFEVLATEKTLRRLLPVAGSKKLTKCEVVVRLDGIARCHTTGKLFSLEHKTFTRFAPNDLEIDAQFTAQIWVGQEYAKECGLDEPIVGVIYNGLRKQAPGPRVRIALFERHKIFRNEAEINAFLHRAYWMYKDSQKWEIFAQPSMMECNMCDFRNACTEKLRGGDFQFLLDNNYTKRKEKEKEVEPNESE